MSAEPTSIVTLLAGAITVLSATVAFLYREVRSLNAKLVEAYRDIDARREKEAETWRTALDHLKEISEQSKRRAGRA